MNWSNSWNDKPNLAKEQYPNSFDKVIAKNPKPSLYPEWDKLDQTALLTAHESMQKQLSELKASELELRKYIVNRAFPDKKEGMNTLELEDGSKLKAGVKFSYNLSENKIVEDGLDEIAKIGNQGAFIADRLVSWKPNFLLTEYRAICKDAEDGSVEAKQMLQIIAKFLTISDEAAPTLEIKESKKK